MGTSGEKFCPWIFAFDLLIYVQKENHSSLQWFLRNCSSKSRPSFRNVDSVKFRFLLLIEQFVQMASLDSIVKTIAIVWTQSLVKKKVDIALQDVHPDGQEKIVNNVRQ